ncbi:SDR family NAD(P)-dependent oxidoreductase [uncultured Cohaesibacter sp.]|uniref:SDR family NAD(P)-dependent oxidoreductase n=1 Tax=uncultured Cohaesibacter sp. TaxID=1002546 RepID=UPI002931847D|nr:SDR family NAD(P)-dependent oxidoreductase [uncultured Cohaesibacter sp.]
MSEELKTRWHTVWIIGASSGTGAALGQLFAKAGARVIISARRTEKLNTLAALNPSLYPLPLDVADTRSIMHALLTLEEQSLLPDLTIYCAAVYEPGGVEALTFKEAERHMRINYLGVVGVIEALLPKLKQKGRGGIAIVSSLTSYCGLPMAAFYGPTKAALASLCETLKPEFDRMGLDLYLINPGFIDTQLTRKNAFDMPFLMSADEAAFRIFKGVERSAFEIAFPARLALGLRLMRLLPYRLFFKLTGRMLS